jgi:hypothetical protein
MSFLLLVAAAPSHVRHAELYIEIEPAVSDVHGNQIVDVVIGNRGALASRDNFDAAIAIEGNGKPICRAVTNFVTPIAPGESIHALRFQMPGNASSAAAKFAVLGSIRPWDHNQTVIQKEAVITLLPGTATCFALKPIQ